MSLATDTESTTVILLKPDGFRKASVREFAANAIDEAGLKIVHRQHIDLNAEDVWDIWPKLHDPDHPIVAEFTRLYMTSGTVEYFVVRAESNVVARALEVRKRVRELVGTAAFENGMHTAENDIEQDEILRKFAPTHLQQPYIRGPEISATPGLYGRGAEFPRPALIALINDMWGVRRRLGWEGIFVTEGTEGEPHLRLLPGDPNSIDFGISTILHHIEEIDERSAISKYIQSEVNGSSVLFSGDMSRVLDLNSAFHSVAMRTEVVEGGTH